MRLPDTWVRVFTLDNDYIDVDDSYEIIKANITGSLPNDYIEFKTIAGYRRTIRVEHITSFCESGVDFIVRSKEIEEQIHDMIDPTPTWDKD